MRHDESSSGRRRDFTIVRSSSFKINTSHEEIKRFLNVLKKGQNLIIFHDFEEQRGLPRGGGVLPYISYIGVCRPKRYGF